MSDPTFIHVFQPGEAGRPPLLLLHGTGGDEHDLMDLGAMVAPGAPLLSPRGKVTENGALRFFRRHAEGVLDEEDLRARTHELADFVAAARTARGLPAPIAVGFSNGANIAAALMLLRPETLSGAVLMRPMTPFEAQPAPAGPPAPALILSGAADPIASEATAKRLEEMLETAGGMVERRVVPAGHGLTQFDVTAAQDWIAARVQALAA